MNIQHRILTCRLLNKMERHEEICIRLDLEDISTFISPTAENSEKGRTGRSITVNNRNRRSYKEI